MKIAQKIIVYVSECFPFFGGIVITSLVMWTAMMLTGKRQKAERVATLTGEIVIVFLLGQLAICLANWMLEGI